MSNTTDTSPSSSPTEQQQQQAPQPQSQPTKRSSRRANTAERRATHNAVERLRRETLNGRFLDLAAMLPALAAQRRPSKSAIVNQSIALITTQRRSRLTAARELRLIKTENDALRQELNEWRNRNSLQLVEEPPRSADLLALLALEEDGAEGEEMMLSLMNSRRAAFEIGGEDEEFGEEGEEGEGGLLSPESALPYGAAQTALTIPSIGHKVHPSSVHHQQHHNQQHHNQQQHQQQQQQAHYAAAAAAQQQAAVFEQQTAAMVRAQLAAAARSTYPQQQQQQQQQMYGTPTATENSFFTGGSGEMYGAEYAGAPWSQKAASTLATPPGTSHGHSHSQTHGHPHGNGNGMKSEPSPSSYANAAFLSSSPYGATSHHSHSHPHYHHQGANLGMFKPGGGGGAGGRSDDEGDSVSIGESTGSSHFSSVSDLSASLSNSMMMAGGGPCSSSPVDHTFSFNMGGMMGGMPMQPLPMSLSMGMVPMMGMGGMGGVNMGGGMNMGGMSMPSPPHSISPGGSQPQSRRPSINIPSSYGTSTSGSNGGGNPNGSKHASPNPSPGPTPTQAQTQFVGMGLMM